MVLTAEHLIFWEIWPQNEQCCSAILVPSGWVCVHYYNKPDCIFKEIRPNQTDIKYKLTFDESLSHQVVVHRLRNNFGNVIAIKLDERVAFAFSCLRAESCNPKWSISHFTFIIE